MKKLVKISIIVPIYNVEKYLEECLNSVIKQTFKDFELILVNDGSTDSSLSICEKFKKRDKRIKVFNTPNRGVSAARNLGITQAAGELITFLDPDDWISPIMYEEMNKKMLDEEIDVCMCGYNTFKGKNEREDSIKLTQENRQLSKREIVDYLIPNMVGPESLNSGNTTIMGNVWRLLIKKKIIINNNLNFIDKLPLMEDLVFCLDLFTKTDKVYFMKDCFYNYRLNEQSAVHSYRENMIGLQMRVFTLMQDIIKKNGYDSKNKERLSNRYCELYIWAIKNELSSSNKSDFKRKLLSVRNLCEDERLLAILNEIDTSKFSFKRKFLLWSIKNIQIVLIYIYFKILQIVKK